jgi:hypothetical protein
LTAIRDRNRPGQTDNLECTPSVIFPVNSSNLRTHTNNLIAKYFYFAFIAVTAFVSCSDNDQTIETTGTYNSVIIDTASSKTNGSDSSLLKSMFERSAGNRNLTGLPENTTQSTSSALPGNNNDNLNPAHGQPRHRCEIAVGAPLDSKPETPNPTQIQPVASASQIVPINNASTGNQKVIAGINPAHGQPNHRCDIAVGAPLNSKPTVNTSSPSNIQPAAVTTTTSVPSTQKVAPGMNPAHGQPNHRCDIAVGEPLNSKPTPIAPAKLDSAQK